MKGNYYCEALYDDRSANIIKGCVYPVWVSTVHGTDGLKGFLIETSGGDIYTEGQEKFLTRFKVVNQ